MVEPALILPPKPDERWQLAAQMGVEKAVIHPLEIGDDRTQWSYDDLLRLYNWLAELNLQFSVLEGSVPISERIRLGREGRNEDIEQFKRFLRACGSVGIPVICYDWMAGVRWARTQAYVESRGASYVTAYNVDDTDGHPPVAGFDDVSRSQLWNALEYFLQEVIPVAEEVGVRLGLHPDDPPRANLRGIPRIITSVEAYDRVLELHPSTYNGITFCQGNFVAMGANIPATVERFADRIHFVHFRDVEGNADQFVEKWHDAGPTNMLAAMQAYVDHLDDGIPIRPDHVPTMAGEDNSNPGYHTKGRLFAIGYMKGLLEHTHSGGT